MKSTVALKTVVVEVNCDLNRCARSWEASGAAQALPLDRFHTGCVLHFWVVNERCVTRKRLSLLQVCNADARNVKQIWCSLCDVLSRSVKRWTSGNQRPRLS